MAKCGSSALGPRASGRLGDLVEDRPSPLEGVQHRLRSRHPSRRDRKVNQIVGLARFGATRVVHRPLLPVGAGLQQAGQCLEVGTGAAQPLAAFGFVGRRLRKPQCFLEFRDLPMASPLEGGAPLRIVRRGVAQKAVHERVTGEVLGIRYARTY
jgi:hypothetical protein